MNSSHVVCTGYTVSVIDPELNELESSKLGLQHRTQSQLFVAKCFFRILECKF